MKLFQFGPLSLFGLILLVGCGQPAIGTYSASPDSDEVQELRQQLAKSAPAAGAGAQTETAAKATGWASLKGRFVYDGDPPKPKPLDVNKDQSVCGKHQLVSESLEVGSDGGLANVVLFVRNRRVEIHPDYETDASKPVVLDNSGCRFEPHIATVRIGQPLMVKNSDPVPHNTNADLKANDPFNVVIAANSDTEQKLSAAESLPAVVSCTIHPWMKGYVLVQPHPYMVVTGKDGAFELKNLPAGVPLEFQLWHEASSGKNGALVIEAGDVKSQENGRFTITLQPDEVRDLKEIKVPAAKFSAG